MVFCANQLDPEAVEAKTDEDDSSAKNLARQWFPTDLKEVFQVVISVPLLFDKDLATTPTMLLQTRPKAWQAVWTKNFIPSYSSTGGGDKMPERAL